MQADDTPYKVLLETVSIEPTKVSMHVLNTKNNVKLNLELGALQVRKQVGFNFQSVSRPAVPSKSPITNCPIFIQLRTNKALCTTERLKLPFIN